MADLPPTPRRVLTVMAHPDDVEFMAGGTVSRWARAGAELHYCLLTDGNSGSRDPNLTPERLASIRRDEQRAAGALLNVAGYTFLGHPDGRLVPSIELRLQIARVIRQVQPDAVVTSDPTFFYSPNYTNHPDHRAAGEATLAAIMPIANTRLAAPELLAEGLEPHDVQHVYIASPVTPTLWMPIEQDDMERKFATMAAHASQVGSGWDYKGMLGGIAQETAGVAREHGVACEFAEAFVYINLNRGESNESRDDQQETPAEAVTSAESEH